MEKSEQYMDGSTTSTNGVATKTSAKETFVETQDSLTQFDKDKKLSRTPGLKIFDVLLYPLLTNGVVFGMSVAATYLTTKGGNRDASGKLIYGKLGNWFHKRGESLKGTFTKAGMTDSQADMSKMVFFSFLDGSVMAPVVKLCEDHREDIGRAIDIKLGKCPEDESVYKAEPKQSWLSVIGGRLATVSLVVPTAVALDKSGLNDVLFSNPGKKLGHYIESKPSVAKRFGKFDIPELGKIGAFEAFYTSVCTAGIYFTSRLIAKIGKSNEEAKMAATSADTVPASQKPYVTVSSSATDSDDQKFTQTVVSHKNSKTNQMQSFTQRLTSEPQLQPSRV